MPLGQLSERRSGEWVFPRADGNEPLNRNRPLYFWTKLRDEAGIMVADARLHDLRHSHASHAIMNGESLHMAGRLLGHRRATTTNRCAHLDEATLSEAAERVAMVVEKRLLTLLSDCPEQLRLASPHYSRLAADLSEASGIGRVDGGFRGGFSLRVGD